MKFTASWFCPIINLLKKDCISWLIQKSLNETDAVLMNSGPVQLTYTIYLKGLREHQ